MEKLIFDGNVRIHDDGRVYVKDSTRRFVEANVAVIRPRNREYLLSYYYLDGVQHHFYPAREIAQAFVPNPENHPFVENIDGNVYNLHVDNIRWISNSDRMVKVWETRRKNNIVCEVCGHDYHKDWDECPECKKEELRLESIQKRKQAKLDKIAEKFKYVDRDELPSDYLNILERRLAGETYAEIGEVYGVSRQAIQQKLNRMEKGDIPFTNSKTKLKNKIAKLEKDLEKYDDTQNMNNMEE